MTGEKKWERKVGEGSYHYLTSLVPMDDGSYVAFGGKKTEARYASWIVSFDAKGEGIREDVERTGGIWGTMTAEQRADARRAFDAREAIARQLRDGTARTAD